MGTDADNPHRCRLEDIRDDAHEIRTRSDSEKDRLRDAPPPHDPCPAHSRLMDALFERVSDTKALASGVERLADFACNGLGDRVAAITAAATAQAVHDELIKFKAREPAFSLFGWIVSNPLYKKFMTGLMVSILAAATAQLRNYVNAKTVAMTAAQEAADVAEQQIAKERDERRAQWRVSQSNQVEMMLLLQREIAALKRNP